MPRGKDPAWDPFEEALVARLTNKTHRAKSKAAERNGRLHPNDVADALNRYAVDADQTWTGEDVRHWRDGVKHPPLALLAEISRVLYEDSTPRRGSVLATEPSLRLLYEMGVLPAQPRVDSLVDRAYRLQKLDVKISEALDAAASDVLTRGASNIVQAAISTGRWAVAVWPALEGPDGYEMRVGDRIDFRRCDGHPVEADEVWAEPELKAALRAAFAVRGDRQPRWSDEDAPVSRWGVPHIGRPSSPTLLHQEHRFRSLSFTSLTGHSWVNDVASLTAMALGYGFTMTRDLAVETTGMPHDQTPDSERRDIHAALLASPPRRRVWSHHAPLGRANNNPFTHPDVSAQASGEVIHVRVRESDSLLQLARSQGEAATDLFKHRAVVDAVAAQVPAERLITVQMDYHDSNAERWADVLRGVDTVLGELHARGVLTDLRHAHDRLRERSSKVGVPLLRWLSDRQCPALG